MTEGPLRASASPLTLRSALEGHSRFTVEDPEAQRFRHFARVTGLVTGRAQNRTYVHFGSKACALLCKKPRFPNFHPFHYYGFCSYRPRTQGKYEEGTSAKRVGTRLTEGRLALGRGARTGEGRGAGRAGPVGQSFQRLRSGASAKSGKSSSTGRGNQTFKAFEGPSALRLKRKERAHTGNSALPHRTSGTSVSATQHAGS